MSPPAASTEDIRRKRSVPSGNKSRRVSFVDIMTSAGNKSRKVSFVDDVTGASMGRSVVWEDLRAFRSAPVNCKTGKVTSSQVSHEIG